MVFGFYITGHMIQRVGHARQAQVSIVLSLLEVPIITKDVGQVPSVKCLRALFIQNSMGTTHLNLKLMGTLHSQ